ncbi:unnamed protein product [Euphydryas editha]|uniref:Uncharacterized protein n=1 Tax=Euphydryas editha TaxID=104508 RepID=A0AAU9TNB6_EUPED|nr:unnamed protein product [Euphydryas editha]
MRNFNGCGRRFVSGQEPGDNSGTTRHGPCGTSQFGSRFGSHCHGHHGHHGHRGHGHEDHRCGGHGHRGHGHGPFGHHRHHHVHHKHNGPHGEFNFIGHRFWGPMGRFEPFERRGFGGDASGPCRGHGQEEQRRRGRCQGNKQGNSTEETVLVRGIVIQRDRRPKSV